MSQSGRRILMPAEGLRLKGLRLGLFLSALLAASPGMAGEIRAKVVNRKGKGVKGVVVFVREIPGKSYAPSKEVLRRASISPHAEQHPPRPGAVVRRPFDRFITTGRPRLSRARSSLKIMVPEVGVEPTRS